MLQPGSRALAEHVLLFFAALSLILVLTLLLVNMLGGLYSQAISNVRSRLPHALLSIDVWRFTLTLTHDI